MIEPLTIEKLTEYGFAESFIERLQNWDGYECFCHNNNGFFWASNVENKIYSGKEATRRNYFRGDYISFPIEDLDLVPEYYQLRCDNFIESQRKSAGAIFSEKNAKERFRDDEIVITKKAIADNEKYLIMPSLRIKSEKLRHYLIWLTELNEPVAMNNDSKPSLSPFDEFMNELLKLDVRVTEYYQTETGYISEYTLKDLPDQNYKTAKYLDLRHYSQFESDYESNLKELQLVALTDIIKLDESQIKRQLKRLEHFQERMTRCLKLYLEFGEAFNSKNNWSITDLEIKIYPLLNVKKHEYGIISEGFVFDLHDALMFKDTFLAGFVRQVKDIYEIEERMLSNAESIETKSKALQRELNKFGFFLLPKVSILSEANKIKLIGSLSSKGLPYSIAMFDFLGYLEFLGKEYFHTKTDLNKAISNWFISDKDGRAVKGNINSLSARTTENKQKYTAHTHKERVVKDYQQLK